MTKNFIAIFGKYFLRLLAFPLLMFITPNVLACDFCDDEIVLDKINAICFLEKVEPELQAMKTAGLEIQLFNLTSCSETGESDMRGETDRAEGAQTIISREEIRNSTPYTEASLTPSFILDEVGIRCLESHIRSHLDQLDPAFAFRRLEECFE